MNTFDFNKQLNTSYDGVESLIGWLRSLQTVKRVENVQNDRTFFYKGDILIETNDAQTKFIEVKIESRSTSQTPNLAIERYSDTTRKTDGGPWSTSAEFYAHIYSDKILCIMLTSELKVWLNKEIKTFRRFDAKNVGYVTSGILVPRVIVQSKLNSYKEVDITSPKADWLPTNEEMK